MTKPTHTHRQHGGRYAELNQFDGGGALEGQKLVAYRDLYKDVTSATTLDDWRQHWRPVAADDCTVCLGTGRDSIKGNKGRPCGGCYGLGKVRKDGETPEDLWQLAEVAARIIQQKERELFGLRTTLEDTEVQQAIAWARQKHQDESTRKEQQWRESGGRGHGGRRHTGD